MKSLEEELQVAMRGLKLPPNEMRRAIKIADDVADLVLREMRGEDVSDDLEFAQAAAKNIIAAYSLTADRVIRDVVCGFLLDVVLRWAGRKN